ncbi:MAG: alpha/beta fold hydrolase [Pseudomonadales bacterium]|nr:alpha/beta fold hydrolase [Pseudomonadales bacterium]
MHLLAVLFAFFFLTTTTLTAADSAPADDSPPIDGISFRYVESNGITMRIAEAGTGPTVLMAHGFPESWFSWRHQLKALAAAGFHAVAPDMRGYGLTSAPAEPEQYLLDILAADMVGILDALNVEQAHMAGHDWGSPVASHTVVRYPDRFKSLTLMSVPYGPRAPSPPMAGMKQRVGDNFFYMLYHNEPGGVAEAEYDANAREFLYSIYQSPTSPRKPPEITDPKRAAGGWLPRMGEPLGLPDWLSQAELDYYVGQFERSGFRGGVNYYRNFDGNWEASADITNPVIQVPTLFLAGEQDMVIGGANADQIRSRMGPMVPNLTIKLIPNIGHWVQQEAATDTNSAFLDFLDGLSQ